MSKHSIIAQRTIKAIQLCSDLLDPMDYLSCTDEDDLRAAIADTLFETYNLEILDEESRYMELPDKFVEEWKDFKEAAKHL